MIMHAIEMTSEEIQIPMRYEAYLAWDTDGKIVEWVDGEAIIHMPPSRRHQQLLQFLFQLIDQFVRIGDYGRAMMPPFEVKIQPGGSSREPDIFFVATEHADRLEAKRLNGPPDLVVEVISPSSVTRDRDEKFREYEAAGVPEYWIIDSRPGYHRTDFYRLNESGRYMLFATEDEDRVESHILPNFWIRPAWLAQDPLPDPLLALAQIIGTEALIDHLRKASGGGNF